MGSHTPREWHQHRHWDVPEAGPQLDESPQAAAETMGSGAGDRLEDPRGGERDRPGSMKRSGDDAGVKRHREDPSGGARTSSRVGPRRWRTTLLGGLALVAVSFTGCSGGSAGPAWRAVTGLSMFSAATVHDVSSNASGFVAVGSVVTNGVPNGAIWTSTDGLTWQAVPVDAPSATFLRVAHTAGGLVAIGSQCGGGGECVGSSFWTSPDGTTWTERGGYQDMIYLGSLASGGFGVVAAGADWSTGYPQNPPDVAAYVSRDGSTWMRAATDAGFKAATIGAVAAGAPGIVALGNRASSLTAWTSSDGMTWAAVPAADALGSGEARDMLLHGSTVVAVGRDGQDGVGWTSTDGTSWSRTPSGAAPLQSAVLERLASTPALVVAVGKDNAAGAGAVWTSTDGLAWTKASSIPGDSIDLNAVAAAGTTLVAFGTTANGSIVIVRAQVGS